MLGRASFVGDLFKQANKKIAATTPWVDINLGNVWKSLERAFPAIKIFGPTASEIVKDLDLSDKTCLITGGGSGIGLEIARCLNSRKCNLLLPSRNKYAVNRMAKTVFEHQQGVRLYDMNLASLASVKNCSEEIIKNHNNIDIVILNAGVFGIPWILTEDGIEMTFQVNYLSQYYLLSALDKILSPNVRVVVVSSESHRYVNWSWNTALMPAEEHISLPADKYTSIRAYNISKLCSILMVQYLGNRWLNSNRSIFAAHPGSFVKTRLCQNWWVYEALYTMMIPFTKSIAQAASTPVYCAVSPDLTNQTAYYFKNCNRTEVSSLASDRHLAYRINDVTNDILRDRIPDLLPPQRYMQPVKQVEKVDMGPKHDELMTNYSG